MSMVVRPAPQNQNSNTVVILILPMFGLVPRLSMYYKKQIHSLCIFAIQWLNVLIFCTIFSKIHISKVTKLQLGDTFSMDRVLPPVTNSLGEPQETYLINEMRIVATSVSK